MVRELAWRVLRSGSPTPLREVEHAARDAELDPRDRGLLRRLVGTEIRRRGTLRALVRQFARGKPDLDLAAHLHLGLVQIFFLDQIPDHAAVGETVAAAKATLSPKKAGYVNAALRAAIQARRPGVSGDPRRDLALREVHLAEAVFPDPREHPLMWAESALSMPAQIVRQWTRRFGEERAFALSRTALVEPPLSLRVRADDSGIAAALEAAGCAPRPGLHPRILLVDSDRSESVLASKLFADGSLTVQGETALRAAELLEPREDDRLLDLCAAPGGKTIVLADAGARVLACDSSPPRLLRLRDTLRRLGPQGRVDLAACSFGDGAKEEVFDGVLVDAPCSNTGVLAQRPEARWRYGPASQKSLAELQARLLRAGALRVKRGGRLVYSTCSLEVEENGRVVQAFLRDRPEFQLETSFEALPDAGSPAGPVDGGFAARLRRRT
ncbi:MAG: transcription antitermination factor NusB [Planctomycetota bacterium]